MQELWTYLAPGVQLFFFFILTIVWVAGFVRQRNLGFLLLALGTFAVAALSVIRQAIFNAVLYHSANNIPVGQRGTTIALVTWSTLILSIVLWLMMIIGALLVVFQRPKLPDTEVPSPPA